MTERFNQRLMKVRGTFRRGNREAGGLARQVLACIAKYLQRQEIIDHIFGTFKRQWGMEYTLIKGREKVETEYRLAAMAYNLSRVLSIFGLERLEKELKRLQNRLFAWFCTCGATWVLTTVEYRTNYLL